MKKLRVVRLEFGADDRSATAAVARKHKNLFIFILSGFKQ